jgi:hypothetical protein
MDDLGTDVSQVVNTPGCGQAIVLSHALGPFVTKSSSSPQKALTIIVAARVSQQIPPEDIGMKDW